MAKIIGVGGIKGGVGKTTIATNLAIDFSNDGNKVLLVDADEQESSTTFTSFRKASPDIETTYTTAQIRDRSIKTEIPELAQKFQNLLRLLITCS